MAGVGTQLTQPEAGWKRVDSTHACMIASGNWSLSTDEVNAGYYKNTAHWSTDNNARFKFRFYGTKIRKVAQVFSNRATNCKIIIDGEEFDYNGRLNHVGNAGIPNMLLFEKVDLPLGIHEVEVYGLNLDSNNGLLIDSFDIGDDGEIIHPILNKNEDIVYLRVGEYIPCDYSQDGGFTNFGSGSTLNLICVKNKNKESVLVSDRVLNNMSFNDVNYKGYIYGNDIEHNYGEGFDLSIRSMSGEVKSTDGIISEYDRYIVNSNLGGLITPGDKDIWNWGVATITSSSPTNPSCVVTRGNASVNQYYEGLGIGVRAIDSGFRPMLVVSKLHMDPDFNLERFGIYSGNINISNITIDSKLKDKKVKVKVENTNLNSVILDTELIPIVEGSVSPSLVIDTTNAEPNITNNIMVTVFDEVGYTSSKPMSIFKAVDVSVIHQGEMVSDKIHKSSDKTHLLCSFESVGDYVALFKDTDGYKLSPYREYASISSNTTDIRVLLDKDSKINGYGVMFTNDN